VVKAGVLAQRTLNKASQTAIAALIERSFKDHQPVK
jgi:hypothetical protein